MCLILQNCRKHAGEYLIAYKICERVPDGYQSIFSSAKFVKYELGQRFEHLVQCDKYFPNLYVHGFAMLPDAQLLKDEFTRFSWSLREGINIADLCIVKFKFEGNIFIDVFDEVASNIVTPIEEIS